ncbi:MAG: hypothetical protein CK529_10260 [Rhodospirillaceae bacterium]|nr:MAG: hypothetical protein CK529_10260 [Rhodospirillaceae bacterium]
MREVLFWKAIAVNVGAPLVSVLMASLAMLATAHAQEVPAGYQVSPMTRATIFVRDLDVSLKLYPTPVITRPMK